jgi:hypothetical protein
MWRTTIASRSRLAGRTSDSMLIRFPRASQLGRVRAAARIIARR